jgi:hypothetical protein
MGNLHPFERKNLFPAQGKIFLSPEKKFSLPSTLGTPLAIARLRPANTCSSPTPHRHTCEKKSNVKNHNKPRFRHHSQRR